MAMVVRRDTAQDVCGRIADFLTEHPYSWTQSVIARDSVGASCMTFDPGARSWCALGLLEKFVERTQRGLIPECLKLLSRVIAPAGTPFVPIHRYNDADRRTVADMVRVFRCASLMPTVARCDFVIAPDAVGFSAYEQKLVEEVMKLPPMSPVMAPNWTKIALESPWSKFVAQVRESLPVAA